MQGNQRIAVFGSVLFNQLPVLGSIDKLFEKLRINHRSAGGKYVVERNVLAAVFFPYVLCIRQINAGRTYRTASPDFHYNVNRIRNRNSPPLLFIFIGPRSQRFEILGVFRKSLKNGGCRLVNVTHKSLVLRLHAARIKIDLDEAENCINCRVILHPRNI